MPVTITTQTPDVSEYGKAGVDSQELNWGRFTDLVGRMVCMLQIAPILMIVAELPRCSGVAGLRICAAGSKPRVVSRV